MSSLSFPKVQIDIPVRRKRQMGAKTFDAKERGESDSPADRRSHLEGRAHSLDGGIPSTKMDGPLADARLVRAQVRSPNAEGRRSAPEAVAQMVEEKRGEVYVGRDST